jgi:hypothetical protein
VQEDAKVIPLNAEFVAYRIFVAFIQKYSAEQSTISGGQRVHYRTYVPAEFVGKQPLVGVADAAGRFGSAVIPLGQAPLAAEMFQNYVVAHGIHKCPQLSRILQAPPVSQELQNSYEDFLPEVFHVLSRPEAKPKLRAQQIGKVVGEVLLCIAITIRQPAHVLFVEREEFP